MKGPRGFACLGPDPAICQTGETLFGSKRCRRVCLTLHFSRFLLMELGRRPWGVWLPVIHSCSSGTCASRNFPVQCNPSVRPNLQNPKALLPRLSTSNNQLNRLHILRQPVAAACSPPGGDGCPSSGHPFPGILLLWGKVCKHLNLIPPIAESPSLLLSPCPGMCEIDVCSLWCLRLSCPSPLRCIFFRLNQSSFFPDGFFF